jgi:hypothetical protein
MGYVGGHLGTCIQLIVIACLWRDLLVVATFLDLARMYGSGVEFIQAVQNEKGRAGVELQARSWW